MITVTPLPNAAVPYIAVTVNGLAAYAGGTLTVIRVDPDGTRSPLREADPNVTVDVSGSHSFFDYEAPFGQPVTYTATASKTPAADLVQVAAAVTLNQDVPWMIHPGSPILSVKLEIGRLDPRVRAAKSARFDPIGRRTPIIYTDGVRKSVSSGMTVNLADEAGLDAFLTLMDTTSALLFNVPASFGWGIGAEWIMAGDLTETPFVGGSWTRSLTFSYDVVDRPVGSVNLTRTWYDVMNEALTWDDVVAMYPTSAGLLTGAQGT